MKRIAVLGSTGSVGSSTLDVIEAFPDRFKVVALSAGHNIAGLRSQLQRHHPAVVAVSNSDDARGLAAEFPGTRFVSGPAGLVEASAATDADLVVIAVVGAAGLEPTVMAIRAGKQIALANKETLVVAGELVMSEAAKTGVSLLPIDSEHCGIHQVLPPLEAVSKIVLTASGGPFRTSTSEEMSNATVAEALDHPTWRMGPKISIDSATMMNKGLEIIEAHHLFGLPEERIEVVIHPQSLVHALVHCNDGTAVAQMGINDLRVPILYALSWPERLANPWPVLDLIRASPLTFEAPDPVRFPALDLARRAIRLGGEMPAVLNAANEAAVALFLKQRCSLPEIPGMVEAALDHWQNRNRPIESIRQALAIGADVRRIVNTSRNTSLML